MTLIGLDSRSEEFDNLTLTVGMGTKLTLQDVRITGDKTLLSLAGGNTLTLLGENRLIGCADASGNACPTVISGGDLTICGSGSLKLQALVNNAAFMGAETSKISIGNCLISVFKSDKLGFDGGAFCANGADLTMTNATFFGRTDSDNVAVLSADTIAMTGCTLRVEAEKSVHAVLGRVSLTNCGLYASGHSGNSAKTVSQTTGVEALQTLAQQSGVRTLAASGFADVRAEDACLQDVLTCTAAGIMTGTGQDRFSPEKPMTRAMLVTVLHRAAGSPSAATGTAFSDVPSGAYYTDAVAWASANSIVTGYGNGRFGSNDPVSRAQIATILWRYAGSPSAEAGQDFADESSIPAFASAAVDWARANGVVNGTTGNRFDPNGNATRAQVATILRNYLTMTHVTPQPDPGTGSKILVAYFSGSGNTERVAQDIAGELGADLFEITPVTPYTSADLDWTVDGSRVNREHDNEALRDIALTQTTPANWDEYDTVFIGYPIWWGIAAWPVNNFVRGNDFSGKTVIPFATSSSSGMGQSGTLLEEMAGTGDWQDGQRFSSGASQSDVADWVSGLGLNG